MDVKSLLHLGCAKVASLIKGIHCFVSLIIDLGQPLEKIKDILAVDQTANQRAAAAEQKDEKKE
jgi:hypothetical protein